MARKIRAKDPFGAVKARIRDIRHRPSLHEPLKESRARELFARRIALPLAKKTWGNRLKAVLLVGSAQPGVRRASRKREYSDLDMVFVVSRHRDFGRRGTRGRIVADGLKDSINAHSSELGFRVQVIPQSARGFKERETEGIGLTPEGWRPRGPFTVLHGLENVESILGKRLMAEVRSRPYPGKKP